MVHHISETIIGLWTSPFNTSPQPLKAQSEETKFRSGSQPLVPQSESGLTWHLNSGLMGASSSLSHTPEDVWLFEHFYRDCEALKRRGNETQRKGLMEDGLLLDAEPFSDRIFKLEPMVEWAAILRKVRFLNSIIVLRRHQPDFLVDAQYW